MKIKDWLTKNRWIQGHKFDDKRGLPLGLGGGEDSYQNSKIRKACLEGTVEYCYPGEEWARVFSIIRAKLDCPIHVWNDDPKRTWEDVHSLVKELDI